MTIIPTTGDFGRDGAGLMHEDELPCAPCSILPKVLSFPAEWRMPFLVPLLRDVRHAERNLLYDPINEMTPSEILFAHARSLS
jgi:hypothetical protein